MKRMARGAKRKSKGTRGGKKDDDGTVRKIVSPFSNVFATLPIR